MDHAPSFVALDEVIGERKRSRLTLVCWIAALVSGLVPWFSCFPAPLVDWPNHLSRVFIEMRLLAGDDFWSRFYEFNPKLVPNLALDVGIGGLAELGLPIDVAGGVFLAATFLMFLFGIGRLARASDADDATTPLLATILFLSGPMMFGLANYYFGLGMAFFAAALWIEGTVRTRWIVAVLATPVIFTMHLIAALIFVIVIGAQDLAAWIRAIRRRRLDLAASTSSVAAFVICTALVLTSPTGADSLPDVAGSNIWYPGGWDFLATLNWKVRLLVNLFTHHATVVAAAGTWIGVVAFIAMAIAFARGHLSLGAHIAIWVMAAAMLLAPDSMGHGSLLDYRLLVVPPALMAAMLRLDWQDERTRRVATFVVLAICVLRGASFAIDFRDEAAEFRTFEAVVAKLPPGGIILSARGRSILQIPLRAGWISPIAHLATRAVPAGQFVPSIFAVESQQPMILKEPFTKWRTNWFIPTDRELAGMIRDIAPLCAPGGWDGPVLVYVAYPRSATIPKAAIVAEGQAYVLAEACKLGSAAGS